MEREKALVIISELDRVVRIIECETIAGLCWIITFKEVSREVGEIIIKNRPWYTYISPLFLNKFWWKPTKKEPRLKYIKKLIKKYEKFI